jgi:Na+/phosphate symporter
MIFKSLSYTSRSFHSTIYAASDMEVCIFHQAIQLMQLYDISLSMLKKILGLHSKKRKKRDKKVRREREKIGQVSY